MPFSLQQIEIALQTLVDRLSEAVFSKDHTTLLAKRILDALRDYLEQQESGRAPEKFTIFMHPEDLKNIPPGTEWSDRISAALIETGGQIGLEFSTDPLIQFAPDQSLTPGDIEIIAEGKGRAIGSTAVYRQASFEADSTLNPGDLHAYLILEGQNLFQLNRPVYNLGRRKENDLVIDDPRVSRNHAQLRFSNGHYRVFDLNSTGGTFVNQQRIVQHQLAPGDVISLAGYAIIYGQERATGQTGPAGGTTTELPAGKEDGAE